MEIERRTLVEIVVSVVGVGGFIAAIMVIGALFGNGGLTEQGALALVVSIVLFIVVMTGVGYWLSGFEA